MFEMPRRGFDVTRRGFDVTRRGRARRIGLGLVAAPAAALAASVVFSVGLVQHGLFGSQPTTSTSVGPTGRDYTQNSQRIDMDRLPALHRLLRAI